MKAHLALCTASAPHVPAALPSAEPAAGAETESAEETLEAYAARDGARVRRNIEVMKAHKEVIIVRHSDHSVGVYPPDQAIDDGIIVARRLPNGEIGWYDPDAGPRTDPSAFKSAPKGSPRALPTIERGADGLLHVDGEVADPVVQRMFPAP